jgi:hypothetical protein
MNMLVPGAFVTHTPLTVTPRRQLGPEGAVVMAVQSGVARVTSYPVEVEQGFGMVVVGGAQGVTPGTHAWALAYEHAPETVMV